MSEPQINMQEQSRSDDLNAALSGGESEFVISDEQAKPSVNMNLIYALVFVVLAGGAFLLYKRQGPAKASASRVETAQAQQTINNFLTTGPSGIKAMEELQTVNPGDKETASNAMVTFMALNTAGIQLIPATIIGVLAAAGAKNPTAIIVTTIVATLSGATAAVIAAKILQRFFPQPPAIGPAGGPRPAEEERA